MIGTLLCNFTLVVAISVSHHQCHPAGQRTQRWLVYGDTEIFDMEWVTGGNSDPAVTEIDWATGGTYSSDPGVESLISSHHLTSYHFTVQ